MRDYRFAHGTLRLLHSAGLYTHRDVRSTSPEHLQRIVVEKNRREGVFGEVPDHSVFVHLTRNVIAPDDREIVEMDLPGDNDFPFWGNARLADERGTGTTAEAL